MRDLAESPEVGELLLLDLDGERAAQVADEHGGGKASARAVDARDDLAAEIAGCATLVNAASSGSTSWRWRGPLTPAATTSTSAACTG